MQAAVQCTSFSSLQPPLLLHLMNGEIVNLISAVLSMCRYGEECMHSAAHCREAADATNTLLVSSLLTIPTKPATSSRCACST